LMKYEYRPVNSLFKTGVIYDMEKLQIKYNNSPFGLFGDVLHEFFTFTKRD